MRAGCRRVLKWIGIGFFVFFCMIPLGIALFQEATGIVILPTKEPLPTSVALAVPSETPAATNILPSATNTLPSATNTLPSATATMTDTATATSTVTDTPTVTPTLAPEDIAKQAFANAFGRGREDELETLIVNDRVVTMRFPLNTISAYLARREAELQFPDLVCELREAGLTNRTYQITGMISVILATGHTQSVEGVETIIPPDVVDSLNCEDDYSRMNINLAVLAERYDVHPLLLEDE